MGANRTILKSKREWRVFLLFAAPNLILFGLFTYWPILYTGYLSFVRWKLPDPSPAFVGLENYRQLFRDPDFWQVLANTGLYALVVVALAQGMAFALALLLNRKFHGRALLRTLAFTPYITTTVAAALVWVLLLDPKLGPLSFFYEIAGVEGPHWLADARLALWAVISVGVWREIGFATLFFLSGLQGLPRDVYEAARIEGARSAALLRHITLPLMSPVAFFLMVSGFIAAVKIFDTVAIMTEGGPVYPSSSTYVYHLYQVGFRDYRFGYASCLAVVFFLMTFIFVALQLRLRNRWVHYE